MPIQVLNAPVTLEELRRLAMDQFGDFVKAGVDVGRSVMAIGESCTLTRKPQCSKKGLARQISGASTCIPTGRRQS